MRSIIITYTYIQTLRTPFFRMIVFACFLFQFFVAHFAAKYSGFVTHCPSRKIRAVIVVGKLHRVSYRSTIIYAGAEITRHSTPPLWSQNWMSDEWEREKKKEHFAPTHKNNSHFIFSTSSLSFSHSLFPFLLIF